METETTTRMHKQKCKGTNVYMYTYTHALTHACIHDLNLMHLSVETCVGITGFESTHTCTSCRFWRRKKQLQRGLSKRRCVCMSLCMYLCNYVCIYMYVYVCMCVCVCVCAGMQVFMYRACLSFSPFTAT